MRTEKFEVTIVHTDELGPLNTGSIQYHLQTWANAIHETGPNTVTVTKTHSEKS